MSESKKTLKKSIVAAFLGVSAMTFSGPLSLAAEHCKCDKECSEKCAEGDTKDCKCEHCNHEKGKKCKNCERKKAKAEAKTEGAAPAKPAAH